MIRRRVIALGQVQSVGFRYRCQREAAGYGVAGWVRNLPDGSVEAVFEGEPDRVRRMVDWTRRGPRRAQVVGVNVYEEDPEGLSGFTIESMPRSAH